MHIMLWQTLSFDWNLPKFPRVSNKQKNSTVSDNGREPDNDKSVSEPMLTWFVDAYMHHLALMSWSYIVHEYLAISKE